MRRSSFVGLLVCMVVLASGCGGARDSEGTTSTIEGQTIAYQDGDGEYASVWMIRADGSGAHGPVIQGSAPDWSPDGSKIAVGYGAIFTATGGRIADIQGPYEDPAWSPDGRRIAYTGNDKNVSGPDYSTIHLLLVDRAAGRQTRFAEDVGYWASPSWAPDGRRLAYVQSGYNPSPGGSILVADLKTRRVVGSVGTGSAPAWSPRGDEIAFSTGHAIVVAAANGKARRTIIRSPHWLDQPAWSPDATQIAYAVFTEYGNPETSLGLRIVDVDGTHYRALTDSGSHPDWRPR